MTTLSQLTHEELKEAVEWLGMELADDVEQARLLYEDMKANGLTIGTAEAEGYLRGYLTALNSFHRIIYGDKQ
jgi:hypothetical protein